MSLLTVFHVGLCLWLALCAVQDLRTRTVSNWLTIPALVIGLGMAIYQGGLVLGMALLTLVVFILIHVKGGTGGADVKVLAALAGLWPAAYVLALVLTVVWSLGAILRRRFQAHNETTFAGLPPMALGAVISLLTELVPMSIILVESRTSPLGELRLFVV